ncbi:MAG: response regulator [Deltaproteobacteria bacterium]|jgi:PAS domain S-box-containing protein|nr:response regulator [Deltaproteobacteria bacterium]
MSTAKIFIVEDEAIVAESLNDQLEALGYIVTGKAPSGEEALRNIKNNLPNLVLMDIMLEGEMDGVETAQQIRELYGIPVIFLSAYSDSETLGRAKLTEPFGYLIKPYKDRELHTTLEITLYKHRMEKRVREHERWLDTLLRSIGDGVITVGIDGLLTSMSPVAEMLTGLKEAEQIKKDLLGILQIEESGVYPIMPDLIDQALDGETVSCLVDDEPILLNANGKRIVIDFSAAPIRNDQDEIIGAVLTMRDISARKQAEIELSEARQILSNSLTPREKEILQLMVNGSSTKEIAFDLKISHRTVEAHRQNMMVKLDAGDMTMLVRFAVTHKLVPFD